MQLSPSFSLAEFTASATTKAQGIANTPGARQIAHRLPVPDRRHDRQRPGPEGLGQPPSPVVEHRNRLGLPDDNPHSPNEKFSLTAYTKGMKMSALLWPELANA